ncbi:MAG: response regulator [Synergistaceae bacterium]|jgi:signal transduction histidine kinase/CheY-like chemotaxis protein|nr:response regulator [Synergistaceae bacterium]
MFRYVRDILYRPEQASLDLEKLPEGFQDLGRGLQYLCACVSETRKLAKALSRGDLSVELPSSNNEMAAPLKALYASLKHLSWQTQQVAKGDYRQRVEFMGDFANSFNTMIEQLDKQRAELTEAKTVAEVASESKSAFLANVSHEIRTPLNAILGLSELELREELPAHTRSSLEKILNSGSSLLDMVNDILDISKIESGHGFEITPVDYSVSNLINDVVQLNIVRIESKNIAFRIEIEDTIPATLHGDELRVRQVLSNLLSNAFKYTGEGRVTFRAGWQRRGDNALLAFTVSDTGVGIRKEDTEKLFREYSQLNSRANRNIEGTGLGLAITKHLVEMMDGEIFMKSEYGVGSTFGVHLLQRIVDATPMDRVVAENLRNLRFMENRSNRSKKFARAYMPGGKVLVVDDVPTNLEVAKGFMLPYGLAVDCATSGPEAIEKVRAISDDPASKRYDAIFMDHMMPGMDGIEATRIIRGEIDSAYARTVPIIAFTANALAGNREMFLANGFNSFISKPIDIMQLDVELNRWVRDRQSEEVPAEAEPEEAPVDSGIFDGLHTEGLDLAAGVRRYESEAVYLGILRSYVTYTTSLLERLARPLDSLSDYMTAVHGLKGSSFGICAETIGKLAEELEDRARAGDVASVLAGNESFIEKVRKLLEDTGKTIEIASRASESAARARLPEPNRELLEKMLDGARHIRTSQMEETLARLEKYAYDADQELVLWLREKMDNLDYRAIRDRLERSKTEK